MALELWRNHRATPSSIFDEVWNMLEDRDSFSSPRARPHMTDRVLSPACDVVETEDSFILSFDVPGLRKEDLDIEVTGRNLVVSGERKHESDVHKGSLHRVERSYGKFSRTFALPEGCNTEAVDAAYENGVLKIDIKKDESKKTRKIQIGEGEKGFFKRLSVKTDTKAS